MGSDLMVHMHWWTASAWVPVLASLLVLAGTLVTAERTYRAGRENRESSEREAVANREHAAREANMARMAEHKRLVYLEATEALYDLNGLANEVMHGPDRDITQENLERRYDLGHRYNSLLARVQLMGSPQAALLLARAWSSYRIVIHMREADVKVKQVEYYLLAERDQQDFVEKARRDLGLDDSNGEP